MTNEIKFEKSIINKKYKKDIINNKNFDVLIDDNNDIPIIANKNKRKTISKIIKIPVWYEYIRKNIGITKCVCCKEKDIGQLNFHCGHVVNVQNDGPNNIENLRPICSSCNYNIFYFVLAKFETLNVQNKILNLDYYFT